MVSGTLLFDKTFEDDPAILPGCCPNTIYALLFNQQQQAMKPDGITGIYTFQTYTKATHATFAFLLAEHSERTFHYSNTIGPDFHEIPVTPDGEYYYIEFWHREGDTAYSRSEDHLKEVRRVYFTGESFSLSRLNAKDIADAAVYKTNCGFAYDSQLSKVRFVAWLEKNGQIVDDAIDVTVRWLDREGNELANVVQSNQVGLAGMFVWEQILMDLDPDEATPMTVSIRDADGVAHQGGACSITWD